MPENTELAFRVSQRVDIPQVTHVHVDFNNGPSHVGFLFRSDAHHDNKKCVREVEYEHLQGAVTRGYGILDFGDTFCAMQGKYDKRASKAGLRDEHHEDDYVDRLVATTAEDYAPFARNWVLLAQGNHEHSILDRCGVDLTRRLTQEMKLLSPNSGVQHSTYQGWVCFHFKSGTRYQSYNVRYTHGYGGGGPVTMDTIQLNRQLVILEDVDMVVSGHTHHKWHTKQVRERVDRMGNLCYRQVDALKCGTYKEEFSQGMGFAVMKGHPPRPLGGWWVEFGCSHKGDRHETGRFLTHRIYDTQQF